MPTSTVSQITGMVCGTVILLGTLGGVFALAWHKSITGGEALGIVGTVIGLAGGALGVHAGVTAGAKSARALPPQ